SGASGPLPLNAAPAAQPVRPSTKLALDRPPGVASAKSPWEAHVAPPSDEWAIASRAGIGRMTPPVEDVPTTQRSLAPLHAVPPHETAPFVVLSWGSSFHEDPASALTKTVSTATSAMEKRNDPAATPTPPATTHIE